MNDLVKLQFILDRLPMTVAERKEATQSLVALQNILNPLQTEVAELRAKVAELEAKLNNANK
jgi:uncharacterized protein YlxW (UPF0749 family)